MNKKQARIEKKIRITPLVVIIGILVFITATPMVAQDFEKGLEAYDAGDYVTALNEFQSLAEQGDTAAQNILGIMYFKGKGVSQDYAEAVMWYRKAAEQGYAAAQYNLGIMYFKGKGVSQHYAEAAKWFRKAAEQGYDLAQFNLGVMYANGEGVLKDDVRSHMWFNIAAANGNKIARLSRDKRASRMPPADVSKAQSMARECMNSNYQNCGW